MNWRIFYTTGNWPPPLFDLAAPPLCSSIYHTAYLLEAYHWIADPRCMEDILPLASVRLLACKFSIRHEIPRRSSWNTSLPTGCCNAEFLSLALWRRRMDPCRFRKMKFRIYLKTTFLNTEYNELSKNNNLWSKEQQLNKPTFKYWTNTDTV